MPAIALSSSVPSDRAAVDSSFYRLCHRAIQSSMAIFTLPILASPLALGTAIRPSGMRLHSATRSQEWATASTLMPTYPNEMMAAVRPEMGQDDGLSLKLNGNVIAEATHNDRKMSGNGGKGVGLKILYGRFHTPAACRSGGRG